jgi:hypothetical protein
MTAIGRSALEKIFASTEYKRWATNPANATDAYKIAMEFTGRSRYAQGFQTLCRENKPVIPVPPPPPPPDPPPTPPVGALSPVWRRDAVYCIGLSSFDGSKRGPAKIAGFTAVYVQLLHGMAGSFDANADEIAVFRREGWTVCGWGTYGQGSDPENDGRRSAEIVRQLGLAGWKANGEAWAEGADSWKTQAFVDGWKAGGAPGPLGWSVLSSDTANFAREYAYGAAMAVEGSDIDIQVYGSTYPTYTVGAGLGMLEKAKVPPARTTMTFDVNAEGIGPFADYRTWSGPRRIWTGDAARPVTFEALG